MTPQRMLGLMMLPPVSLPIEKPTSPAAVAAPGPALEPDAEGRIEVTVVAERLGMPIAHDGAHGLWALGPRSGDRRVLERARMPDLVLQDFDGDAFDLASLRGRKVVLIAWASW